MYKVFYVHDGQDGPQEWKHFLEVAGLQVVLLTNGAECVERLTRERPDLVLCDVLLDGPNGFEVCRSIRRVHGPHDLPVIICSSIYRSRVYRDEALAAGAQRYCLKPVRLDDLVETICTTIKEARSERRRAHPAA